LEVKSRYGLSTTYFNALFIGLYYILRKYYRKEFGADRKRAEEYCFTYQRWDIIKNKKYLV
jgi:nitrate/nitrite transporter NarK